MMMGFVWLALFVIPIVDALKSDHYRNAMEIARSEEAKRQAFSKQYVVVFPARRGEHVASVEIFTPFREIVERAIQASHLFQDYSLPRATEESQEFGNRIRVRVRVVLPPNTVPMSSGVAFGYAYRVVIAYQFVFV